MLKPISTKAYQIAIEELGITAPVYSAIELEDGSIQFVTRNGIMTWRPKPRKSKPRKKARKTNTLPQEVTQ